MIFYIIPEYSIPDFIINISPFPYFLPLIVSSYMHQVFQNIIICRYTVGAVRCTWIQSNVPNKFPWLRDVRYDKSCLGSRVWRKYWPPILPGQCFQLCHVYHWICWGFGGQLPNRRSVACCSHYWYFYMYRLQYMYYCIPFFLHVHYKCTMVHVVSNILHGFDVNAITETAAYLSADAYVSNKTDMISVFVHVVSMWYYKYLSLQISECTSSHIRLLTGTYYLNNRTPISSIDL